jgi:hypothetical protein
MAIVNDDLILTPITQERYEKYTEQLKKMIEVVSIFFKLKIYSLFSRTILNPDLLAFSTTRSHSVQSISTADPAQVVSKRNFNAVSNKNRCSSNKWPCKLNNSSQLMTETTPKSAEQ